MGKTLKKYLLFDLDTTAFKEEFGPKRYTVAYSMIRQFLENCGFEHRKNGLLDYGFYRNRRKAPGFIYGDIRR